ncbi:porin [Enterobacteriaceae bacterium H11S18]|uniref:porin n=1 Tax=Enterobacteriaceae TaxID=543 RepID=UPI0019289E94|nr:MULTISPECIES: porin [Enterobacteriaceae]MCT4704731.1 porin [Dryocola clanedunensis]MCT4711883.1 porin [Dryocola clanedunensis]
MKTKICALSLIAMMASFSTQAAEIYKGKDGSNLDLYGRLGFNISDKKTGDTQGDFDGRFGISGRQVVNDTVSVIGLAQYQVNSAEYANNVEGDNDSLTARYVWAGLDMSEYGKITGGRVSSGLIMFTDIGDVFASSDVSTGRQARRIDPTAVQVFRQDGTVQYQNTFGNLDFSTAYIIGNNTSDLDYGYNSAMRYTLDMGDAGKLAPVIAFQKTRANQSANSRTDGADTFTYGGIGTRYYLNSLMLGLLYSQDTVTYSNGYEDSKDKNWEFTAAYDINSDWTVRAGYRHLDNDGGDKLELRDTTFEAQYRLTPRSSLYAAYILRNGHNGTNVMNGDVVSFGGSSASESFYHTGLRYEF